jgi:hypothetical protein
MEKIEIFTNEEAYKRVNDSLKLPKETQRFKFYQGKIHQEMFGTKKTTDTHIYWSFSTYVPRFENNTLFYTMKDKEGFTYDKKKNTLNSWWSKPIHKLHPTMINDIIKSFNCEWYSAMPEGLRNLLTLPLLKRIVKKKITNPIDYIKSYLKSSPYKACNISPRIMYDFFANPELDHRFRNIKAIRKILEYSTNANHAFDLILRFNKDYQFGILMEDMYNQAAALNCLVNPTWSVSRMKEFHNEMTRKIMEIEVKSLEKIEYNYPNIFDTIKIEGIDLIKDNYELFEEGTVMKHCVYTNYSVSVAKKTYFVLKYTYGKVRATVGLMISDAIFSDKKKVQVQQMYGVGNSNIDSFHKERVEEWLNEPEVQDFFFDVYDSNQVSLKVPENELMVFGEMINVGIH